MRAAFNRSAGELKSAHLRLVQNCEGIVAYGGADRERAQTMLKFDENMNIRCVTCAFSSHMC
jgi:ABC-type uncharacterized transport system fused permease/ATPase subunit